MLTGVLPHDAVVAYLRASNIANFDWVNGPYYKEVPEDVIGGTFPWIMYDMRYVGRDWTFTAAYVDKWEFELNVYSYEQPSSSQQDIGALSSPYGLTSQSPVAYMEHITKNCTVLNTSYFNCIAFMLKSYNVELDPQRGPDGTRVWVGKAVWEMQITADLP